MTRTATISPMARAIVVVGAVAALVTGVTFAALSGTATLSANSISTTEASLLVSNGGAYGESAPGFVIEDLVPGEGSDPQLFYLKNDSGADLNITATVPSEVEYTGGLTGADVKVTFANLHSTCTEDPVVTTLAALKAGEVELPCNPLSAGAEGSGTVAGTEGNYSVVFDIDPSAPVGSSASASGFDVVFNGTQPTPEEPEETVEG